MNTIVLSQPPPNHTYSVSVERAETESERNVRLFKDVALFMVAVGFLTLVVWACFTTLAGEKASAEEKKWAMSVLSAATGGIIGYLVRK